jgi:hypothetical protein
MTELREGRWTAEADEGNVVFLIGMRVNRWRKPWRWVPVAAAMPRMLAELARNPDLGLLGAMTFVGGRTTLVVQYWRSFDHLASYARNPQQAHLPAWRAFNRRARGNRDVGVFHESYVMTPRGMESVYVNMPEFGVGKATRSVPVAERGQSAAHRLDPQVPDDPAVAASG